MPRQTQLKIVDFMDAISQLSLNPRSKGKPLQGKHSEIWRYRVNDYRILCEIKDKAITVLVLTIGHRKDIYKK